ncbi:XRE family transcriptional regulator [Desulfobacca acetoxidans]|uniref:UTP--glucose-1-phosphate uridylyltransferase n=1 Tax=Desulfobacca acetoxidans (strain ATCC 700848 / DSM 11109 / ASRB2) TaxID=880072 RepID=F2NDB2_DESAR|nr:XRE family transcriptional regulator [Desulfobacca acetoxidans]AEB09978.1 transcriptional regulator, XRE family [Desulfobacca acetoxidans DSM 11109]
MEKKPKLHFGHLMRQSREAAGISQRALAQQAGLDVSYINRLESGERRPRRGTLLKLASALRITGQELEAWLMAGDLAPTPLLASLRNQLGRTAVAAGPDVSGQTPEAETLSLWERLEASGLDEVSLRRLLHNLAASDESLQKQSAAMVAAAVNLAADYLAAPVHRAIIPAAGGQHRLLAMHVMQHLLLQMMGEAASAGVCQFMLILAPGTAETLYQPLQTALNLAVVPRFSLNFCVQEAPRGLGDAVLQAASWVGQEPFLVLLPDEMLDRRRPHDMPRELQHMSTAFRQLNQAPLIAVEPSSKARLPQGGVVRLGRLAIPPRIFQVEELVEKPATSNPIIDSPTSRSIVGRYFLPPQIFQTLEHLKGQGTPTLELTDALEYMRHQQTAVYAYELKTSRRDLGGVIERAEELIGEI